MSMVSSTFSAEIYEDFEIECRVYSVANTDGGVTGVTSHPLKQLKVIMLFFSSRVIFVCLAFLNSNVILNTNLSHQRLQIFMILLLQCLVFCEIHYIR